MHFANWPAPLPCCLKEEEEDADALKDDEAMVCCWDDDWAEEEEASCMPEAAGTMGAIATRLVTWEEGREVARGTGG